MSGPSPADIYQRLGVPTIINAWGTMTKLGGSLMDHRVLEAMVEASRAYVEIPRLQRAAAERIAALLGAPAACITTGAAAGLAVAAAACMSGADPRKVAQLPDTTGMRATVLILATHRFVYDHATTLSGARLLEVGTPGSATVEDLRVALDDDVAMVLYAGLAEAIPGTPSVADLAGLLLPRGIPLVVDAAAELPPRSNIPRYLRNGASLVVVSGGKAIRGPQGSGLILGEEELVARCAANNFPNVSIGRPMKTDKETIVGLLRAVELFCETDFDAQRVEWEAIVADVLAGLAPEPAITARRVVPTVPDIQPMDVPRVYASAAGVDPAQLQAALLSRARPIAVGLSIDRQEIAINPQCLGRHQVHTLVDGIRAAVSGWPAHSAANGQLAADRRHST